MDGATIFLWLIVIFIVSKRILRARSLPPGPVGLPVFGNFLNLALACYRNELQPHEAFSQWVHRYGKVFSFWFGNTLVVVLNDVTSAREAFTSGDIADRPTISTLNKHNGSGVAFGSGPIWRDQRKFLVDIFSRLGIGKSSFEKIISTEVQHLALEFKANKDIPFSPQVLFNKATYNVISSVVLGQRFSYSDTEFTDVVRRIDRNFQIIGSGGALLFFPFLRYIPGMSKLLDEYAFNRDKTMAFVDDIVKKHKTNFDRENPTDYVDMCLLEIENRKADGTDASEDNLVATIQDLLTKGSETTSLSLSWFLLYMTAYPEVQRKIHQEIDLVVGRGRLPQLGDRPRVPYTEAVTLEVMRLQTVAPSALPHSASRQTYIQGIQEHVQGSLVLGHRVPKGAIVVSNIWHMLHDPEIWDDPYKFKPERFLNEEGHVESKADFMVPFGIGRRACLGEEIAKTELFIFITQLMHQFTFNTDDDSPPISFRGRSSAYNGPQPFKLVAFSRDI